MANLVIGLAGPKRSGKDTGYTMIREILEPYDIVVHQIAFADPIKDAICNICNITREQLDQIKTDSNAILNYQFNNQEKSVKIDGREFLRGIGMLMRGYDDNQFNCYVGDFIGNLPDYQTNVVVITDVRFDNEAEMIQTCRMAHNQTNGIVIKVEREGVEYDQTVTERGLATNKIDYLVINSSLNDYKKQLDFIINKQLSKLCGSDWQLRKMKV